MPEDADAKLRLKRMALQIVGELPENPRDALMILDYAREVIENFLIAEPREREPESGNIVPFKG